MDLKNPEKSSPLLKYEKIDANAFCLSWRLLEFRMERESLIRDFVTARPAEASPLKVQRFRED